MEADDAPASSETHPPESPLLAQLPQPPVSASGCSIALGWRRAAVFRPHVHGRLQIAITGPGSSFLARWRVSGGRWRKVSLTDEHVWLIPAGVAHSLEWRRGAPLVAIEVEDPVLDSLGRRPLNHVSLVPLRRYTRRDALLAELCALTWRECRSAGPRHAMAIVALGQTLLAHLLPAFFAPTTAGSQRQWLLPRPALARVLAHIERDPSQDLSLRTLASVAGGFSPSYFGQLFKAATGLSPAVYVTGVRVRAARDLLRTGEHTVAEVAQLVGFSSQQRLCDAFARHTGSQPSDYLPGSEKNPRVIEKSRKPVRWVFR